LDWDLADLAAAGLNNSGVQNSPGHGLMAMRCCGTHSVVLASEDLTAPWFQGLSRFSMNGTCSVPEAPHPLRRPLAALVLILQAVVYQRPQSGDAALSRTHVVCLNGKQRLPSGDCIVHSHEVEASKLPL